MAADVVELFDLFTSFRETLDYAMDRIRRKPPISLFQRPTNTTTEKLRDLANCAVCPSKEIPPFNGGTVAA